MGLTIERWVQELKKVMPTADSFILVYLAKALRFVHVPKRVAILLLKGLNIDDRLAEAAVMQEYSRDPPEGRWWRQFVQDGTHERVIKILADFAVFLPEQPEWLRLETRITKSGDERIAKIAVDYVKLAKEVKDALHLRIGLKHGDVTLVVAYDESEGIYTKDGLSVAVSYIYRRLQDAEEFIKMAYDAEVTLATRKNVDEVINALKIFGEPVERVLADFDDYSRYLPVANGILDMETGELHDFSPEFHFTFKIATPYDPNADESIAEEYVSSLVAPEDVENFKRALGYILVPGQPWKKFFILQGPSNSGKTTLLKLLTRIFGKENVAAENLHDLTTDRFHLINLVGKLVNLSSEQPELRRHSDVQRLKAVTGGDTVVVERKHKQPYSAAINAKLFFAGNRIPELPPDDLALWKRIVLIRFPHVFQEDPQKEAELFEKLPKPLLKAMLRWRKLVMKDGFLPSMTLDELKRAATLSYNPVRVFVDDMLVEDADSRVTVVDLYKTFVQWASSQGLTHDHNDLVLDPDFLEDVLEKKGPAGIRRKLIKFGQRLRDALDAAGIDYEVEYPRVGDARLTAIRGIALADAPARDEAQPVETIDISSEPSTQAEKVKLVINAIRDLNRKFDAVDVEDVKQELQSFGLSEEDIVSALDRLKKDGMIAEVKPGLIRLSKGVVA